MKMVNKTTETAEADRHTQFHTKGKRTQTVHGMQQQNHIHSTNQTNHQAANCKNSMVNPPARVQYRLHLVQY